jgi:hypothetical protein
MANRSAKRQNRPGEMNGVTRAPQKTDLAVFSAGPVTVELLSACCYCLCHAFKAGQVIRSTALTVRMD